MQANKDWDEARMLVSVLRRESATDDDSERDSVRGLADK